MNSRSEPFTGSDALGYWLMAAGTSVSLDKTPLPSEMCTTCGGILTIVYDAQPELTWLAAGSLDDSMMPADQSKSWSKSSDSSSSQQML